MWVVVASGFRLVSVVVLMVCMVLLVMSNDVGHAPSCGSFCCVGMFRHVFGGGGGGGGGMPVTVAVLLLVLVLLIVICWWCWCWCWCWVRGCRWCCDVFGHNV